MRRRTHDSNQRHARTADELTADGHGRRTRTHSASHRRRGRRSTQRQIFETPETDAGWARTQAQQQGTHDALTQETESASSHPPPRPPCVLYEQHLRTRGPRSSAAASRVAKHHTTYTAQIARSLTEYQPQPPVRSVLRRQRGGLLGAVCLCGACSHGLGRGLRARLVSSRRTLTYLCCAGTATAAHEEGTGRRQRGVEIWYASLLEPQSALAAGHPPHGLAHTQHSHAQRDARESR